MYEFRIEFQDSCTITAIVIRADSFSHAIAQCELSLGKTYCHYICSIHILL